jgi:hypothetical protein
MMRRALPFVAGFVVGLAIAGGRLAYGLTHVHGEVHDTVVCEAFAVELDRWLEAAGLDPIDACSEFDW